jgi:predicted nucleic acid-binding protein
VIVVDVNVIAYLLIDSERTSETEALLRADPAWAAPLLWRSEWRNVLAGYVRRGSLDRGAALECIEAVERIVRHREYLVDGAQVMDLVASSSCSAYDCEYVALADTFDVPLVTYRRRVLDDFPLRAVNPASYLERSP